MNERHINTVIEDVLQKYFRDGSSTEQLAEDPAPSPWTIRRWIAKFGSMLDVRQQVEEFLISNLESYLPAAWKTTSRTFDGLLKKAQLYR